MAKATLTFVIIFIFSSAIAQLRMSRNSPYGDIVLTDSIFFGKELFFINRDTAIFFLDERESRLSNVSCAPIYRVAPLTQYYQLNGAVTDYYGDNDTVAARLNYKDGLLDGPCVFYYKNGQVREKGTYTKNKRTGVWEYYFENSRRAKTIRMTDAGPYLIDCFRQSGEVLAQNGNGRFEGEVVSGTTSNPTDGRMTGPIKDGLPDGEWEIYNKFTSGPLMVEHFSAGRFVVGNSNSRFGTKEYMDRSFSSVESVHPMEALDYYAYNDFCLVAGKKMNIVGETTKTYPEIDSAFSDLFRSGKYHDYTGWILLDMRYDKKGRLSGKSVRLYGKNSAFETALLSMIDRLSSPGPLRLNGNATPYERFYVLLAQAGEEVMPEEILNKQRMAALFGRN